MTSVNDLTKLTRFVGSPVVADIGEPRPQGLALTFFGIHVLDRQVRAATGSVLEVLARAGVVQHAARSALHRMVERGLLNKHRRGRLVYLGLTPRSQQILADGQARIWDAGVLNESWDGTWTLLGFTVPESQRGRRHLLRSRLLWAGFGALQGGLWIAPARVDVGELLDGIEPAGRIRVFHARAVEPTSVEELIDGAWDLDGLAKAYRLFLDRWSAPPPSPCDPLARQLLITTDWLELVRRDPRLPVEVLPADWPAGPAQQLFRTIHDRLEPEARTLADTLLETITDGASDGADT